MNAQRLRLWLLLNEWVSFFSQNPSHSKSYILAWQWLGFLHNQSRQAKDPVLAQIRIRWWIDQIEADEKLSLEPLYLELISLCIENSDFKQLIIDVSEFIFDDQGEGFKKAFDMILSKYIDHSKKIDDEDIVFLSHILNTYLTEKNQAQEKHHISKKLLSIYNRNMENHLIILPFRFIIDEKTPSELIIKFKILVSYFLKKI